MRYAALFLLGILFAGCLAQPTIKPDQVYQGYPCGNACPAFKQGFEIAQAKGFATELDCAALPLDQTTGCQAYVFENNRSQTDYSDMILQ